MLNHPFTGPAACPAGRTYAASLPGRFREEARSLVQLTDWPYEDVRRRMAATGQPVP